jgi:uncharacterized cupin superfamily protein
MTVGTNILNLDDVELSPRPPMFTAKGEAAQRFDARMGPIGTRLGAQKLGYNLTVVPPGKRAFPLHNHHVNEEMFFILEGTGELRVGADTHAIRKGDFIACPPGGPATAHQIVNTGDVELRYLAVSTRLYPELVEYPDSGKFATIAERGVSPEGVPQMFRYVGREAASLDYWDGE